MANEIGQAKNNITKIGAPFDIFGCVSGRSGVLPTCYRQFCKENNEAFNRSELSRSTKYGNGRIVNPSTTELT